jgi:hypothetical protein
MRHCFFYVMFYSTLFIRCSIFTFKKKKQLNNFAFTVRLLRKKWSKMSLKSVDLPAHSANHNIDFTDECRDHDRTGNFYMNSSESSSLRARLKRKPHYYFNRLRGLVQSQKISTNSTTTTTTTPNNIDNSHSSSGSSSPKYTCETLVVNCHDAQNLDTAIEVGQGVVIPAEIIKQPEASANLISYYSSNFTNSIKARFGTGISVQFVYKG